VSIDEDANSSIASPRCRLKECEFHGYSASGASCRSAGITTSAMELRRTDDIPASAAAARTPAAFADLPPDDLPPALITNSAPAPRSADTATDQPSATSSAFRFFRRACSVFGASRARSGSLFAHRRAPSAYLLRGLSRKEWEHSIPGVEGLRYSVTFRSVVGAGR